MLTRLYNECLLRPEDLTPSDPSLEVVGAFNPGAIAVGDEVVLLVRVAERTKEQREGFTALPRHEPGEGLCIDWVPNDELVVLDPRLVQTKAEELIRLTFFSHIRVIRSKDGRSVDSVEGPRLMPTVEEEEFGVEDPRITKIGDRFYITYVAVSRHGAATALASTTDFQSFERHGIIFCPENKDIVLFPEQIGGEYVAFHRPNPATHFCMPEMWLARSPDLIHWGGHETFHMGAGDWETGRIGAGAPPIRTEEGWLEIYHGNQRPKGAGDVGMYCAGALLLDAENPTTILKRTHEAIMQPEADFECEGFVPNVVFPTGLVERNETVLIYYGAADACVGLVATACPEDMKRGHP